MQKLLYALTTSITITSTCHGAQVLILGDGLCSLLGNLSLLTLFFFFFFFFFCFCFFVFFFSLVAICLALAERERKKD
jgi:hypothetical protein